MTALRHLVLVLIVAHVCADSITLAGVNTTTTVTSITSTNSTLNRTTNSSTPPPLEIEQNRAIPYKPDSRLAINVKAVPLVIGQDGCATSNRDQTCSGNGACKRTPLAFFGVARAFEKRAGYCQCYEGRVGPGCALTVEDLGETLRLKLLAAGWLSYDPFRNAFKQTRKGATQPRFVWRASFTTGLEPLDNDKASTIGLMYRPSEPEAVTLHQWAEPHADDVAAAGAGQQEFFRVNSMVGIPDERRYHAEVYDMTPTPAPTYDPLEVRQAEFTNWRGQSILAPPLNVYQPSYQGEVATSKAPKNDYIVPKLVRTLDIAQDQIVDPYGAPAEGVPLQKDKKVKQLSSKK